ncbi:hypothetical protein Tco_0890730 [Tanacetum coccineum]|uniref:Uncharacterized protein n=1 Tax=Tanacetum coccineum TaxID=301880 RepID=A0ABQ5C4C7_9ASTR
MTLHLLCCGKWGRLGHEEKIDGLGERPRKDLRVYCACLPLVRDKIEFRIDLIPGASPVFSLHIPVAPSEMLELSNQLRKILQEKVFIRPSHFTMRSTSAFCPRKKDDRSSFGISSVEMYEEENIPQTEFRRDMGLMSSQSCSILG